MLALFPSVIVSFLRPLLRRLLLRLLLLLLRLRCLLLLRLLCFSLFQTRPQRLAMIRTLRHGAREQALGQGPSSKVPMAALVALNSSPNFPISRKLPAKRYLTVPNTCT